MCAANDLLLLYYRSDHYDVCTSTTNNSSAATTQPKLNYFSCGDGFVRVTSTHLHYSIQFLCVFYFLRVLCFIYLISMLSCFAPISFIFLFRFVLFYHIVHIYVLICCLFVYHLYQSISESMVLVPEYPILYLTNLNQSTLTSNKDTLPMRTHTCSVNAPKLDLLLTTT